MRTFWLVFSGALLGIVAGAFVITICPFIAIGCIPAGIYRALRDARALRSSPSDQLAEALRDIEEAP